MLPGRAWKHTVGTTNEQPEQAEFQKGILPRATVHRKKTDLATSGSITAEKIKRMMRTIHTGLLSGESRPVVV